MVKTDISMQHVGTGVYVQTVKNIWKYLNIIETSLNMKLKQVRLPTNTYFFFMKIVFLYSYKTIGEYYTTILWKLL